MLHRATADYNAKVKEKTLSQELFPSSSPGQASPQQMRSRFAKPAIGNALRPSAPSTLNALAETSATSKSNQGVKRTHTGFAKACSYGSFEERSPVKSGVPQVKTTEYFAEDDFDSDFDIDVEEPMAKDKVAYPVLPTVKKSSPAKAMFYPTLPRQQTLEKQRGPISPEDSGYGNSIMAAPSQRPLNSSNPIPWSSSPAEHRANPAVVKQVVKSVAVSGARADAQKSAAAAARATAQAKPKRTLPWEDKQEQAEQGVNSRDAAVHDQGADAYTPGTKKNKSDPYAWNTTASAMKEQRKTMRETNVKRVKYTAGTQSALDAFNQKKKRVNVASVFLSEEQQHVLNLVSEKKHSVFFTGSAGTGKSVLLREIISTLRKKHLREPDRVAVTASTGLAACNIGGVTLHSFAGIGLGKEPVPELVRKIKRNQKTKQRWMRTKVLIIDEISMVDGELFDKLEAIARQLRSNGRPFGGIQLIITGDFFQLPPVPDSHSRVSRFAFDAATWNTSIEHTIGLHHVFRQKDPVFAGMLNEMREGRLSQESIEKFRALSRPLKSEVRISDDGNKVIGTIDSTELFPTRAEVDAANTQRMKQLVGNVRTFEARDGGAVQDTAQRNRLLANCMAPETLVFKKGAQVMLIKNVDETLVNGSLGLVRSFMSPPEFDRYQANEKGFRDLINNEDETGEDSLPLKQALAAQRLKDNMTGSTSQLWPLVEFTLADGTTRQLLCEPETWKVELPNGEIQASRQQVPLILAWALSIHKAQGQTLERVKVDLGKVFEKGQAYVALSRATSMDGLQVLRFDPKKVNAHEKVRTFYQNLSRVELLADKKDA